jgi:hypothetical protein
MHCTKQTNLGNYPRKNRREGGGQDWRDLGSKTKIYTICDVMLSI